MPFFLSNRDLELEITTPGEIYEGERFDWNGAIIQVKFQGISLLGKETTDENFNGKINARGLYGEFGIKNCIGYEDILLGEYFPKIGTGWLKKDSKPYSFLSRYERKPLNYTYSINESLNSVIFNCDSGTENGYSYLYSKKITLEDAGFTESYTFSNTGSKLIETTHYVHNFIKPGIENIGSHLTVEFPCDFDYSLLDENVRTEGLIKNNSGKLTFLKEAKADFFFGGIWKALKKCEVKKNMPSWIIKDTLHNLSISETDSFEPWNADLWGYKRNISPEIFYYLKAAPGESIEWSRTYKVSKI